LVGNNAIQVVAAGAAIGSSQHRIHRGARDQHLGGARRFGQQLTWLKKNITPSFLTAKSW
jgi:hypothetical protein